MRIINFQAENFKRITAVEIVPKPNGIIEIRGKNGAGKSSVLDAIFAACCGADAVPSRPIRRGAATARVRVDLGEIIVTRRFTAAAGGSTLTVEAASGARFRSPQHTLDELINAISFDPVAFCRMEPKKQLGELRRLVKLPVDIDALDGRNARDYETRTEVNRDAKRLRGQASGIQYPADLPATPVDIGALTEALRKAGDDNTMLERRKARREETRREAIQMRQTARARLEQAEQLRRSAADLAGQAIELEVQAAAIEAQLETAEPLPEPADTGELVAALEVARTTNAHLDAKARRETLEAEAAALEERAAQLTGAMAERTAQKQAAIAAAEMPIPGLAFGDGEVLFDGLPLDQASQAEKIRVSVGIAMAASPTLRVLCVRDGSVLDSDSLQLLAELVESNDYQCWTEIADDGTDHKTGIIIEDGSVRPPPPQTDQPSLALAGV